MVSAKKQTTEADVQSRIERMKAARAEYEKALRTGKYFGKRLNSEDREIIRGELEYLAYYISKDTWTLTRLTKGVA